MPAAPPSSSVRGGCCCCYNPIAGEAATLNTILHLQLLSTHDSLLNALLLLLLGGGGGGWFTLATRMASLSGHVDPWSCCLQPLRISSIGWLGMLYKQREVP